MKKAYFVLIVRSLTAISIPAKLIKNKYAQFPTKGLFLFI
jgi:hypothetical protein